MWFRTDTIFHIRFSIERFVLRDRQNPQEMRRLPFRKPRDDPGTWHLSWKLEKQTEKEK